MTLATDTELLAMLKRVDCANPGLTLKKAANKALAHTRASIFAILDYVLKREVEAPNSMQDGILVDIPELLYPYGGGAINNRLLDPDQRLEPPHKWTVSVCPFWNIRFKQVYPKGLNPSAIATKPPAALQSLDRSPEELAQLQAQVIAREARYGTIVDAMAMEQCRQLLAGNPIALVALHRWSGSGPKSSPLRGALKLALEKSDSEVK